MPQAAAAAALQLLGRGDQVYRCELTQTSYHWQLRWPDAALTDMSGKVVGHHGAGPVWHAADGSEVGGEVLVSSPAPAKNAIPWLVLKARAPLGHGMFDTVAFITRTVTEGGVAPSGGCDPAHANDIVKVAYQATYTFFQSDPPQPPTH